MERRKEVPDSETNGLRWINGESDSFPGLVLDQYAETLVLKLYSGVWFSRLEEVVGLIRDELLPSRLILRLSRNIQAAARSFGLDDATTIIGEPPPEKLKAFSTSLPRLNFATARRFSR